MKSHASTGMWHLDFTTTLQQFRKDFIGAVTTGGRSLPHRCLATPSKNCRILLFVAVLVIKRWGISVMGNCCLLAGGRWARGTASFLVLFRIWIGTADSHSFNFAFIYVDACRCWPVVEHCNKQYTLELAGSH